MDEPAPSHETVPAHTTPAWEMELLVSGATIFGLLQLPDLLDRTYFRAVNLSPQAYGQMLMPLWLYAKVGVLTLVLTFLAHLCLRGHWVALVGMNSVYPGGIRWDRLGLGPIGRSRFAAATAEMPEAIERADNRASRVFGVGFSFAMLMLAPVLLVLMALVVSVVVSLLFGEGYTLAVLGTVVACVLLPWMIASISDRRFGDRLLATPRFAAAVGAVLGLYGRVGFGPRANPLVSLFASQVGRRRFAAIAIGVIMPVAVVIIMQASLARGQLPFGLFTGLLANDPFSETTSVSDFYADRRASAWSVLPLPYIRSRVVEGPYLELFVPFIPRLHGAALPQACPGKLGDGRDGVDARARLDCLSQLLEIQLDGQPVQVELEASADPETGQPGMLAMLPVSALAPGRHELSLLEPDRRALDGAPSRRYRIPFWK